MYKKQFLIEVTDTFGGEPNYSWVHRYKVGANTLRGALQRLARDYGGGWRKRNDTGDVAEYRVPGRCMVMFVSEWEDHNEGLSHVNRELEN